MAEQEKTRYSDEELAEFKQIIEGMLEKAKESLRGLNGIEYRVIDIQEIPFPEDTFDVVIANMMLYHVPDLSKGLSEVRRVLKAGGVFHCATYGEHGMMEYICGLFREWQVKSRINDSFTLQNGGEKLKPFFSEVRKDLYEDSLEVTDVEDMIRYIQSLAGITELRELPGDTIRSVLVRNMRGGVLHVPKEYGMFTAR